MGKGLLGHGAAGRRVLFLATAVACTTIFCALHLGTREGEGGLGGGAAVLEQRRDFWKDDDSIWVPAHAKVPRGVRAGKMLAQGSGGGSEGEVGFRGGQGGGLADAVYDEAFHEAFHKAYAETFGKTLGQAEGELAGQAARGEAAKAQMAAMNGEEHAVPQVKAPSGSSTPEDEEGGGLDGEEVEPKRWEEEKVLDKEEEEARAEEAADAGASLSIPQDIRHFIKPWGDWMKGAVPKHEEPPKVQEEEEAEEEDQKEEEAMPHEGGGDKDEGREAEEPSAAEPEHAEAKPESTGARKPAPGLTKALRSWGAVPLGAKPALKKGPEYTDGEEHFGNHVHCPMGGCDPLEKAGVNVDSWRGLRGQVDVPRTVPWPAWDPSQDRQAARAMNQRVGRWAKYNTGSNPARWGAAAEPLDDPTAHRLERHGVNVLGTRLARGLEYSAIPLPALDDSEVDKSTMRSRLPATRDAAEALQEERKSDEKLERAGVRVNGSPVDHLEADGSGTKTYNHADGIPDRLVSTAAVPKYRKGGVAAAEQPSSFLLRDDGLSAEHKQPTVGEEGLEVEAKEEAEEGDKETPVEEGGGGEPERELPAEPAATEAVGEADEGAGSGAAAEGEDRGEGEGEEKPEEAEAPPKVAEEGGKAKSKGGWDGGALGSIFG